MTYDAVIVGGGPGGLSAALGLGRARRRVLVCDSGPRRNQAAEEIHNFVTRDGTPPDEFRAIGRAQLAQYPVEIRDVRVERVDGAKGAFRVTLGGGEVVDAKRIVVCTGMIDDMLPVDGFARLWGHGIYQCPYCEGWEHRDEPWVYWVTAATVGHALPFALMLRASWTDRLTVLTDDHAVRLDGEVRARIEGAGIAVRTEKLAEIIGATRLEGVRLADGTLLPCTRMFVHPPQRQVELVRQLGLKLDDSGFVVADPMMCSTSVPGVYAAGDLTTPGQSALFAAAAGSRAAGMVNVDLAMS